MRIMQAVMGGYALTVMPSLLMRANSGSPNAAAPALMKVRGVRMIVCGEFPAGQKLDESFVKQFTGGDNFSGRDIYGGQLEFKPVGKIWLSTNFDPLISVGDRGMMRRLRLIPFDRTFEDRAAGDRLEQQLFAERAGILNLLVREAVKYYTDGLRTSSVVDLAREGFLRRSDTVKGWVDECCRTESDFLIKASEARASYVTYAQDLGKPPLGPQAFSKAMTKAGFPKIKRRSNLMYSGLRLLNN